MNNINNNINNINNNQMKPLKFSDMNKGNQLHNNIQANNFDNNQQNINSNQQQENTNQLRSGGNKQINVPNQNENIDLLNQPTVIDTIINNDQSQQPEGNIVNPGQQGEVNNSLNNQNDVFDNAPLLESVTETNKKQNNNQANNSLNNEELASSTNNPFYTNNKNPFDNNIGDSNISAQPQNPNNIISNQNNKRLLNLHLLSNPQL